MADRHELLDASDDFIEDAVAHADPMVLRGLLYQLTGDEALAAMEVGLLEAGYADVTYLADEADVAAVRRKAVDFLKAHRAKGAPRIDPGPAGRVEKSIRLTAGRNLPADEIDLWKEQLALDPWARALDWREKPDAGRLENFKVAVIGAGMGGLNAAVLLQRAGIPYFVIEKNGDVGGTWLENQYPGARVDSPSRTYTHLYGTDYLFPYAFSPQRYNLAYFNWIADNFGLRKDIILDTEVKSIVWDEAAKLWEIKAEGPGGATSWRVNAVMTSVGFLSRPNMPDIKGIEAFEGQVFHTACWPKDLDVTGKRVAVIGSGATSYQLVAELAKKDCHVDLFQRSPSWCFDVPGYLSRFPEQVTWLDRNFPYITNFIRLRLSFLGGPDSVTPQLRLDPEYRDEHARSARNKLIRAERIALIERKLAGKPHLIEKMIPESPPLATRWVIVDSDYNVLDALAGDNVDLRSDPIVEVKADRIITESGEVPVDIIVYATGFKANDFLWPLHVVGRDGQTIEKLWEKDGARAYVGTLLPGFPNFFMIYGPNTNNLGGLQIVDLEEMVTRFSLECIGGLLTSGKTTVDVSHDAYVRFNAELDICEARMIYSDPRVTSYYKNDHGRSAANLPIDIRRMWRWLRDPAGRKGMELPEADRCIDPRIGGDIFVE